VKPVNPTLGATPLRISRISSIDIGNKSWDSVLFQQGKSILDFDLNVMQRISRENVTQLSRLLVRSGFFTINNISVDATTAIIPDSRVNFFGSYVRVASPTNSPTYATNVSISPAGTSTTNAIFLWLEIWFQEVVPDGIAETADGSADPTAQQKASDVRYYGGETNATLVNELKDTSFGAETTRRIQARWRIRQTTGVNTTLHSKGFADVSGSTVTPNLSVLAQGGKTASQSGRYFRRADQTNVVNSINLNLEFNIEGDTNLFIAGDGTAADALLLNTVDGRVYGIPIGYVYLDAGNAFFADLRDAVSSVASPTALTTGGAATIGAGLARAVVIAGGATDASIATTSPNSGQSSVPLYIRTLGNAPIITKTIQQDSAGTSANPVYSWSGDTNTGLYQYGTGVLGITAGGTGAAAISSTIARFVSDLGAGGDLGAGLPVGVLPTAGLDVFAGGATIRALSNPTISTVTNAATSTSTSYSYRVVAVDRNGNKTAPSAVFTLSTGPTTLSNTVYNVITWASVTNAYTYDVLKYDSSTSSYKQLATGITATTYNDTGTALSNYTIPTQNGTANLNVDGAVTIGLGTTITAGGLIVTAGGATISAGGATITGNSAITGSLGISAGLSVTNTGATIIGNNADTSVLTLKPYAANADGRMDIVAWSSAPGTTNHSAVLRLLKNNNGTTSERWRLSSTTTVEGGTNAGSNFSIDAYGDTGTLIGNALTITRSSRAITIPGALTASGGGTLNGTFAVTASTGNITGTIDALARHTVMVSGTSYGTRRSINLIPSGMTIVAVDNSSTESVDVTLTVTPLTYSDTESSPAAPSSTPGDSVAAGTSTYPARRDHKHARADAYSTTVTNVSSTAVVGTASAVSRGDHTHGYGGYLPAIGVTAAIQTAEAISLDVYGANSNAGLAGVLAVRDTTAMAAGVGGRIVFGGYAGATTAYTAWAGISGQKLNGTAANNAGYLSLWSRVSGGATMTEFFRGYDTGGVYIGVSAYTDPGANNLKVSGNIVATKYNNVTITTPATGSTITIDEGKTFRVSNTMTFTAGAESQSFAFPAAGDTVVTLGATQTLTAKTLTSPTINGGTHTAVTGFSLRSTNAAPYNLTFATSDAMGADRTITFAAGGADRTITLAGNVTTTGAFSTSGTFAITLTSTATTNVTLPTTGTLATLAGTETFTNKTFTSPTLTAPALGVATATSINGLAITTTTGTLTITNAKTLSVSNSITLAATTDAKTFTFPGSINDEVVLLTATQTLSNKTFTTPSLGAATATTVNGVYVGTGGNATNGTALGKTSGNLTGANNTAIGFESQLQGTGATGEKNTSVGSVTLRSLLIGSNNTAIGYSAATSHTASNATAVGSQALLSSTTGDANTAVGTNSLRSVTTAANNTSIGFQALYSAVTTGTNTAVGSNALYATTGAGNVALGYFAGKYETASNSFYVDNQDRTDTAGDKAKALLYGIFDATAANQTLKINAGTVTVLGTINGLTLTAASTGFTIAGGTTSKTLTVSNTMTFTAGADAQTFAFPAAGDTVVTLGATQTLTGKTLTSPVINTGITLNATTTPGAGPGANKIFLYVKSDGNLYYQAGTSSGEIALTSSTPGFTATDEGLVLTGSGGGGGGGGGATSSSANTWTAPQTFSQNAPIILTDMTAAPTPPGTGLTEIYAIGGAVYYRSGTTGNSTVIGGGTGANTGVANTFSALQTFGAAIAVTGNSTVVGTLTGLTGLTVASGGASITGNSTITGTLSGLTGLTVGSGGSSVIGDSSHQTNVARTTAFTSLIVNVTDTSSTASIMKTGVSINSTGTWNGSSAVNRALYVTATGGTTNYAAIFEAGSVGIGTTTPTASLHLASGVSKFGSTNTYTSTTSHVFANSIAIEASAGGTFAINSYYDSTAWKYAGNGFAWLIQENSGSLVFTTAASNAGGHGAATSFSERMRIYSDGTVGIGVALPTVKLDVAGAGKFSTGMTVSANGITVTGNSTITGTLGGLTGLTVASGGITVTGNSTITGTLGGLTGLTVASGGITVTGNSTITGTLGGLTGLTVASGGITVTTGGATVSAGGITVTGNSTITGTLGGLTGLTVASGGITVTGNSTITGTLGGLTGLTVASGGITVTGNSTITGTLRLNGATSNYTIIKAADTSSNVTYTLPSGSPTAGQYLQSAANGDLTWATITIPETVNYARSFLFMGV